MGEYVGRFGETSFSIDLRSQLMLESYVSALDQAMGMIIVKGMINNITRITSTCFLNFIHCEIIFFTYTVNNQIILKTITAYLV